MIDRNASMALGLLLLLTAVPSGCGSDGCTTPDPDNPSGAPMFDIWPKWSLADSTKIAYTHVADTWEDLQQYGEFSVWVVDVVSLERSYITEGVVCDWSPDSDELLITRTGGQLWLIDVLTGEGQLLPVRGQEADFSPCGRKVSFYGGEETTGTWILYLDSMTAEWISSKGGADWSPDGTRLLCDSLVMIHEDGSRIGKIPVDYHWGLPWLARWSPLGSTVAYGAYCEPRDGGSGEVGIWVVNTDGTEQHLVTCPGFRACWAPDGTTLAYGAASPDNEATVIWVINTDGTEKKQVTFP